MTLPGFTLFHVVALFQTPSAFHIFKFGAGHIYLECYECLYLRPWETQKTFDVVHLLYKCHTKNVCRILS